MRLNQRSRRRARQSPSNPLLRAALVCAVLAAATAPSRAARATVGSEDTSAAESEEPGESHGEDAHASGGHGHGAAKAEKVHNWFGLKDRKRFPPIGWAIVNFTILLFLLLKFAGKPFRKFLWERHRQAKAALEEAADLRAQAQERLAEIEKRVKNLDSEIAQIKKDVAEDAEHEKQLIISAAEAEAERIIKTADRTIAEEVKRVQAELEVEAVEAAMSAAEKLLKQQVNETDHTRLHEEYLVQLGPGGGN